MYKDVAKRILAVLMCVCLMLGLTDFSVLTVRAAGGDLSQAKVTIGTDMFIYNGEVQKPSNTDITVSVSGTVLTEGTDYELEFPADADSEDIGEKTITISGLGDYVGTQKTATYEIIAKTISDNDIKATIAEQKIVTVGTAVIPELDTTVDGTNGLKVVFNNELLKGMLEDDYNALMDEAEKAEVDFTYACSGNTGITSSAELIITGVNNFQGSRTEKFVIVNKSLTEDAVITGIEDIYYEDGITTFKPETISITENGMPLDESDYKITYNGNTTKPGVVEVVITGLEEYAGSVYTKSYKIIKNIRIYSEHITTSTIGTQTYTGSKITLENLRVYDNGALLTEGTDYELSYTGNTNAGTAYVAVKGVDGGCYEGSVTFPFMIASGDVSKADITVENCTYAINPQKPTPVVTYNGNVMSDSDYTVTYNKNTEAGTAEVIITGNDINLTGQKKIYFTIAQKSLEDTDDTISVMISEDTFSYDGTERKPTVSVIYTPAAGVSETLTENEDYTLTYTNNKNAGEFETAEVTITGMGNYTGKYTKKFTINPVQLTSVDTEITGLETEYTYTGAAIAPTGIKVKYDGKELQNGTDYTVEYAGNTDVGTATVYIIGKNNYTGTLEETFSIIAKDMEATGISYSLSFNSAPYTFYEIEPTVTVKHRVGGTQIELTEGTDYTVSYEDNTDVGTATVVIKGEGNFTGEHRQTFTITKMSLSKNDSNFEIANMEEFYTYIGNPVIPDGIELGYVDGQILSDTSDYTMTYSNNEAPGTGTITITAKEDSNFTGSIKRNFIIKGDLAFDNETGISDIPDKVFTGDAITLKNTDITVTYLLTDTLLKMGTDYNLDNYESNTEPGTATVEIVGVDGGKYYTSDPVTKDFTILKKDLDDETIDGTADSIKLVVASIPNPEYTGSPIYPELNITYNGYTLVEGTDFEIMEDQSDCTNAGAAYVTIQGIGSRFTGQRVIEFEIDKREITSDTISVAYLDDERVYVGTPITIETEDTPLDITYDDGNLTLLNDEIGYTYSYEKNNEVGTATLVIIGDEVNFTGTARKDFIIKGDLSDTVNTVITVSDQKVYTGSAVTLEEADITVTYFGQTLTYGTDFTLEYIDGTNVEASTVDEEGNVEGAPFTVVGAGTYYIGSNDTQTFVINKKPIDASDITVEGILAEGYTYTSEEIHPDFTLHYGEEVLVQDDDYTLTWENVIDVVEDWENAADEDKPSIIVTATERNYTGTLRIPFKINPQSLNVEETTAKNQVLGEDGTVTGEQDINDSLFISYEGVPVTFENLVVTWNGKELTPATVDEEGNIIEANDYSISYAVDKDENGRADNDEVGMGYLVVTGHGNYAETKEIPFRITGDLSDTEHIEIMAIEPQPYTMQYTEPKVNITYYGQELVEGQDYELSYLNNENVAKIDEENIENSPTVIITGLGNHNDGLGGFVGTETRTYFEIKVRDLSNNEDGMMTLEGLAEEGYSYTGEEIQPTGLVLKNNGYVVDPEQYTISYENNIHGGNPDSENPPYVIITGKYDETTGEGGNYIGSMKVPFTIVGTPINNNAEITFSAVEDQIYTGEAIEPMVTITHMERELVLGEDYEIAWENNVVAARSTIAAAPAVILRGIGDYSGEVKVKFNILPRSLVDYESEFTVNIPDQTYTGEAQIPAPEILNANGEPLVEGVDYTVAAGTDNVNAGTAATITVTGIGNYTGTITPAFNILPKTIVDETLVITGVEDKVYNTKEQTQQPTVVLGELTLTESDYVLTYADNVDAGTATVFVNGAGNYTGTMSVNFNIAPLEITEDIVSIADITDQVYTGTALTPIPTVTYADDTQEINYTLVAGKDYTLNYTGNNEVGTDVAAAVITGTNNFTGSMEKKFTIKGNVALSTVTSIPVQNYTGAEITPEPTVTQAGRTLVKDVDYTLTYKNNTEAGTASIIITGIGNEFGGTKTVTFIISRDISAGLTVVGIGATYLYTGDAIVPALGKVSAYGTVLVKNVDYKVTVTNNINAGTATLTVQGIGNYRGSKSYNFTIAKRSLSQCTISEVPAMTYNGKAIEPPVVLTYEGKNLQSGKDYTLVYMNNTVPGTARIVAKGTGNFTGSKVITFDIQLPELGEVQATTQSTSKVKLTWKKQSTVTGYQIYNNKNKKVAQVKESSKNSYTISGLRAGTSYSYKVRAYVIRGGRTYYSAFSSVVKVSTKLATPKISVKSAKSKQAYISWKKVTGATGYEIYRSTKKNSGYKKVTTTSKRNYTNKKLTSNKGYYYKVRAYRTVNGKKNYSSFSSVKYVIIK